jgi:DNA-binding NarL/FixJ family response regulator
VIVAGALHAATQDRVVHVVRDLPVTVLLVDPARPQVAAMLRACELVVVHGVPADVVLVDLDEVTGAPADIVRALVAAHPDTPVVALSSAAAGTVVLAAVQSGAAGYLLRTAGGAELVDAVHRAAAGETVFSPGLAAAVLEEHTAEAGDGPARLTDREADVLALIVAGYTARQIAGRLVLSPRTVENHVQRMLRKLDLPNRASLVRYAIENGLA